jgi:hypothetical protein
MGRTTAVAMRARVAPSLVIAAAVALTAATGCAASTNATPPPGRPECNGHAACFTGHAISTASNSNRWRVIYSTPTRQTELTGIASIRATDAWVVGYHGFPQARAIVLHWNGETWATARLPAARGFRPDQVMASTAGNVWIDGTTAGGAGELVRFDGRSWQHMPAPAGRWGSSLAAVTGRASAWLIRGGCKSRSWPWNCTSTIEQWTGTRWIASHLRILVSGLAAVGSHIWAVGLTGERPSQGGNGSGHLVLLQQTTSGWQPIAAPHAIVTASPKVIATGTELPQLAAGGDGTAWILCATPGGKSSQGTLFHWSTAPKKKARWTAIPIPVRVGHRPLYVSTQLNADGEIGVWAGAEAHWTGLQWVSASIVRPTRLGAVQLVEAEGIRIEPGSWAIGVSGGFIVNVPSGPGVIAVNGPLYRASCRRCGG